MHETGVEEDGGDETPDLSPLLDLSGIFPTELVEGAGVRSQEFCIDHLVQPERNGKHNDVNKDDEDGERTASQGGAEVHLQSIEEALVPGPLLPVLSLRCIPLAIAPEQTAQ